MSAPDQEHEYEKIKRYFDRADRAFRENKYNEAREHYETVLETIDMVFAGRHDYLEPTLQNLGHMYCQWNQFELALPIFHRLLSLREESSPERRDLILAYYNVANTYEQLDRYEEATHYCKPAEEMSKSLSRGDPLAAQIQKVWARLLMESGESIDLASEPITFSESITAERELDPEMFHVPFSEEALMSEQEYKRPKLVPDRPNPRTGEINRLKTDLTKAEHESTTGSGFIKQAFEKVFSIFQRKTT